MADSKQPVASKKRKLPKWMTDLQHQQAKTVNVGGKSKCSDSEESELETFLKGEKGCNLTASNVITKTMPWLKFEGSISYSHLESDCACICLDILSRLNETFPTVIGFDIEWPVEYIKGASNKTALIQMCFSENECYLFHVSCMRSLPKPLQSLILDSRVILVGVNIESDLWKLERDFDFRIKPVIDRKTVLDLGRLANTKLKSSERWSLEGLCRNVLGKRLDKTESVRCSSWADYPLTRDQQMYACSDALAGFLLYKALVS